MEFLRSLFGFLTQASEPWRAMAVEHLDRVERPRALVADDSRTIQEVVELTLMETDLTLVEVPDGSTAIEFLEAGEFDLLIVAVHMPGKPLDGYWVAEHAKALRPPLPVILLVGAFESFDEERFAACGADLYLKKPFDSWHLQQAVARLLPSPAG